MPDALERLTAALGERYAIERQIGVGGMATVYLAHDLRHDRQVALKLLRPELGAVIGAERFLAEIRTTAKLQHPHILPLFDSGEADGLLYYVMPYVEGVSLRDRLTREKQLAVPESVRIASEVASALDYAHRHNVIHRDIKPENILLHDGRALVADFGIALAVSNAGATRMTETGMSLGTPHYMSPEQAMGEREITARSDVYALGAVTYEMLTGEPPFTGPTAQAIVAKVVTEEPRPLIPKRHTIPAHVEQAVLIALEKLPADRYATAAEFAAALQEGAVVSRVVSAARAPAALGVRRGRAPVVVAAVAAVVLLSTAFAAGRWTRSAPSATPVARFVVHSGTEHQFTGFGFRGIALAPDGNTIVYLGQNARGLQMYRRRLDELTAVPIPGTEGGFNPLVSPDGQWILFWQGTALRRVALEGGSPTTVPTGNLPTVEAAWQDDQTLVVTALDGSLYRLSAAGEPSLITVQDAAGDESGLNVVGALPRGKMLAIAAARTVGGGSAGRLYAVNTRSGERTRLMDQMIVGAAYYDGVLAWTSVEGTLLAAPFDARRLRFTGNSVALAQGVRIAVGGPAQFGISQSGMLVYVPEVPFDLRLVDRGGRAESVVNIQRRFHSPRFSPDGRRIAVDFVQQGSRDVWMMDLRQRNFSRLTFDNDGHDPVWTPDGRRVAYATARGGIIGMFVRDADGSGVADSVYVGGTEHTVGAFLPNGEAAVVLTGGPTGYDLSTIRLAGNREPQPLVATPFNEYYPAISPDGRWLAYVSDESGQQEVYVRPLTGGAKTLVSESGGSEPVWSRNGRELFYRGFGAQGSRLIAVTVQTAPEFHVTGRTPLFDVTEYEPAVPHANYDVSPDGRFLMVYQGRSTELVLIQNWTEEVRRRSTGVRR